MSPEEFTPELVKEWLEHSPPPWTMGAADLAGFRVAQWFYCSRCMGRLSARGILLPRATPIWGKPPEKCAACNL